MKQRQSAIVAGDQANLLAQKLQAQMNEKPPAASIQVTKTMNDKAVIQDADESDLDSDDSEEAKQTEPVDGKTDDK